MWGCIKELANSPTRNPANHLNVLDAKAENNNVTIELFLSVR